MKIDRRLNLVVPLERDSGTIYVHSTPLSKAVFEQNHLLIGRTFSAVYGYGLAENAGPRVAGLLMRDIAKEMGKTAEYIALMAEIRRATNVLMPTETGYEVVMFDTPQIVQALDEDEISEVENNIVFFILASAMHTGGTKKTVLAVMCRLWGGVTTPLPVTEWRPSLLTSTEGATT